MTRTLAASLIPSLTASWAYSCFYMLFKCLMGFKRKWRNKLTSVAAVSSYNLYRTKKIDDLRTIVLRQIINAKCVVPDVPEHSPYRPCLYPGARRHCTMLPPMTTAPWRAILETSSRLPHRPLPLLLLPPSAPPRPRLLRLLRLLLLLLPPPPPLPRGGHSTQVSPLFLRVDLFPPPPTLLHLTRAHTHTHRAGPAPHLLPSALILPSKCVCVCESQVGWGRYHMDAQQQIHPNMGGRERERERERERGHTRARTHRHVLGAITEVSLCPQVPRESTGTADTLPG